MHIYTMGFTKKTAEQFFQMIIENKIQIVIDVRLNNQSQLAGFTKGKDLEYFLKAICDCSYVHDTKFAPTKEILTSYKGGKIDWDEYVSEFEKLIVSRGMIPHFESNYAKYDNVLLLCSEPTPQNCHRKLLAESFSQGKDYKISHL